MADIHHRDNTFRLLCRLINHTSVQLGSAKQRLKSKTVVTCKIKQLQNICKNVSVFYFTCNRRRKHLQNICKNVLEIVTRKIKH